MLNEATTELYNDFPYDIAIKYSGKFKPYRANVRLSSDIIQFNLSKSWKSISKEIQIGLIQELLLKILKKRLTPLKTTSQNIELYNIFIKKLHLGIPKTKIDPILEKSFERINDKYFHGLIEKTNFTWSDSVNKLGSYEYGTDTITISKILMEDTDLLDYVMYHEMLHKKHKYHSKKGRHYHHTTEFRNKESEFKDSKMLERKINSLVRKKRKHFFSLF
ncbi:MAG: hypothetical protein ABIC04_04025 [Nanoarchaeota archaeon]